MKSANEIRKARVYSDLFSSDENIAKKEFRQYCKLYHPDADGSAEAAELFSIIHEIYISKRVVSTSGDINNIIVFRSKADGKGFELTNAVAFNNGMSIVYHTTTKVAIVYDKTYKKFYDNYLKVVENLNYDNTDMEKEFKRYFPKVLKHFETDDGRYLILLDKTSEVLNLGMIVKAYERKGEKFPERQAAWIINRLYNIECFLDFNGLVLNGLTLDNIWVSPEMHTVLIFNGWEYTTKKDESMIGCPKEVYKILPIKIKGTKKSNIKTDLESIKAVGRMLFKGHDNLIHVNKILKAGVKSNDPLNEWELYKQALEKEFGKRTFVVWDEVPYK